LTFKEVLLIDSTTIRLFSDILKGVGRNPKGDGKKKGGLKVHMLIDAVQSVGRFIKITEAKVHDKNFLKSLELISHSMIVFDKAYNYYHQFAIWTQKQVFFVTRLKTNAVYTVIEINRVHYRKKGKAEVLRDEIIEMEYHPEDEAGKRQIKVVKQLRLRKVCYQDEQNRYYEFLTNSFEIPMASFDFSDGDVSTYWLMHPAYSNSEINACKMKDFHRLNISYTHSFERKKWSGALELSIYNVYNRRNSYYYYLDATIVSSTNNAVIPTLKSVSLFPIIPAISLKIDLK